MNTKWLLIGLGSLAVLASFLWFKAHNLENEANNRFLNTPKYVLPESDSMKKCEADKYELIQLVQEILGLIGKTSARDYRDTLSLVEEMQTQLDKSFVVYDYVPEHFLKGRSAIEMIDGKDYEDTFHYLTEAEANFKIAHSLLEQHKCDSDKKKL